MISLSILAFAVIILLLVRRKLKKQIIVSDFRENKEPKVALNKKTRIFQNTDVLRGKEETEVALNEDNENHIRFITRIQLFS